MKTNLKVFRVKLGLNQEQIAEKIGCNRATYASIETGCRIGTMKFWNDFQKAFEIPDAEMWQYTKND